MGSVHASTIDIQNRRRDASTQAKQIESRTGQELNKNWSAATPVCMSRIGQSKIGDEMRPVQSKQIKINVDFAQYQSCAHLCACHRHRPIKIIKKISLSYQNRQRDAPIQPKQNKSGHVPAQTDFRSQKKEQEKLLQLNFKDPTRIPFRVFRT